jgi:hypothetical protein
MKLEITQEFPIAGKGLVGMYDPLRCDGKGSVYLRFAGGGPSFSQPIVKLTSEGEQKAAFSTDTVSGPWGGSQVYDFAVGRDGQVFVLTARLGDKGARKIESAVLSFGDDGKHRFTTELNLPMTVPSRLAVFGSGEFLVTGYRKLESSSGQSREGAEPDVEPVAVVLNRSGELVQQIDFSSEPGAAAAGGPRGALWSREAVDLSSCALGDDGNIYLMFRDKNPLIYVLSRHGTVIGMVNVEAPSERAIAREIHPAPGMGLLLKFGETAGQSKFYPADKTVFSLVDPATGDRIADYESSMRVGSALGCYTSRGLLFVGKAKEARQLAILRALPR